MSKLIRHLTSAAGQQTSLLFGAQILLIATGFGIKKLQTQYLGIELYGVYALISAIILFSSLFFRFGFFASLQVLLAQSNSSSETKSLTGAGLIVTSIIGLLYAFFMFGASFYIDNLFDVAIAHWLRWFTPMFIVVPFRNLVSAVSIGTNKIQISPIYENVTKVLFFIGLGIIGLWGNLNLPLTVFLNLFTLMLSFGVVFRLLNASFENIKKNLLKLWQKNKDYGFNFYIGSTINQSTYKLDELAIAYFVNTTVNGLYSLAVVVTSPIVLASQSLSNSLFKRFSHSKRIPSKVFIVNTLWVIIAYLLLIVLIKPLVIWFFGDSFVDVSTYSYGIGIACVLQGLYQPFNFLSAKSQGKMIRNVALIEAAINVVGNIIFIPIYGVSGAIYTSIAAKGFHFIGKLYYYRKYITLLND